MPKGVAEPTDEDPAVDEKGNYTSEELRRFQEEPEYLLQHRRNLADRRIIEFKYSMAGLESQEIINELFRQSMKSRLGSSHKGKAIASWLIPQFAVGCRRLTPGPGFLEALLRDNVTSIWNDIGSIDDTGIVTKSGKHIDLDVICCATGFDTSFRPHFPIVGRDGIDLAKSWDTNEPQCYFGTTIPNFPNYFCEVPQNVF